MSATAQMKIGLGCLILILTPGCATLSRRDGVPRILTQDALIAEAPGSRYWPELDINPMLRDGVAATEREKETLAAAGLPTDPLPPEYALAISGGGDNGAFGAGLLVGWTQRGTRPEFKIVTGISAGALIAPFAFLGPRYDEVLRKMDGSIRPEDILHWRNWVSGLLTDGFADDRPLASIIDRYVTTGVLAEIAAEYRKGRILLIGTTDLDTGRSVVWNMGVIASSTHPRALHLFREVLLASASIPGVFPAVMIDVTVNGVPYQEMHVDGGVKTQVFLFPPLFFQGLQSQGRFERRERHVFVIRNGRIDPEWDSTRRRSRSVASQALHTLIEDQGVRDLRELYSAAQRDGEDFHVAYMDDRFHYPHETQFSPDYMRHLFDFAYQQSATGEPWRRQLPTANGVPIAAAK